jgi:hypothetical protein
LTKKWTKRIPEKEGESLKNNTVLREETGFSGAPLRSV